MEVTAISKYSILGFPDDLAIQNVGGRVGAALGPQQFLEAFQKLVGTPEVKKFGKRAEMIKMGRDLEENYRRATSAVKAEINDFQSGESLLVVGGGHDYAYPWIRAFGKQARLGCLNLDAHFDLRPHQPVMTSGSPFFRLIEEGLLDPRRLIEFGIQDHANSESLWAYAKQKKIKTVPYSSVRGKVLPKFKTAIQELRKKCDLILISLDLDSCNFSLAPGVSSPQAEGFNATELFSMLEYAACDPKVKSLGIFELSPPLDVQGMTSRFAAQAAWHFLSRRKERT